MTPRLSFRPVRASDEQFLFRLFASTRIDIALASIPAPEKLQMMQMQFRAQSQHYKANYSNADFLIVLREKTSVGRLSVDRGPGEIRLIDLAICPEFRGQGIGTRLLTDLLEEARLNDKPVRLHVYKHDRAQALYERLGFTTIAELELHFFMECRPSRPLIVQSIVKPQKRG